MEKMEKKIKDAIKELWKKYRYSEKDGVITCGNEVAGYSVVVENNKVSLRNYFGTDLCCDISDERYRDILAFVNKINRYMEDGQFELERNKEIRYRTVQYVEPEMQSLTSLLDNMLTEAGEVGFQFYLSLRMFIAALDGKVNRKEGMKQAEEIFIKLFTGDFEEMHFLFEENGTIQPLIIRQEKSRDI